MYLLLLTLSSTLIIVESIYCDNCLIYSGQACVSYGTCQGAYCLYEYAQQSTGQTMLKKSCLNTPLVQFDDGTSLTVYNQCVTKTTNGYQYIVKMCTNANYCNRDCINPVPLPSVGGAVTCYNCCTTNGNDCTTGSCSGNYCIYSLQRTMNGQIKLTKGCSNVAEIQFDDGSIMTQLNMCEAKTSNAGSTYNAMICNTNYCNNACNEGPQRDTAVTCNSCEANNAYDCTGNQCQGNYCIYERSTAQNGIPYVKKSCSMSSFVIYPDNSQSQKINSCEYRTIDGVSYAVNVCNSGSFCNTQCNTSSNISILFSLIMISIVFMIKM